MQGGILNPEELNNIVGLLNATSNVIRYQHDLDNIKCDEIIIYPKKSNNKIRIYIFNHINFFKYFIIILIN